jgi:hypothetical protein
MLDALIVCLIASTLVVSPAGRAQSSRISDFDFTAAEQHLKELHVPQRTLFEAEQGPDGTRGYGLPNPTAARVAVPTQDPPFGSELEWNTFFTYCGWDAIVLATFLDSTPILTSDKRLIYTVSHFAVVDIIKSDVPLTPGRRIVAYRVGGEIEDGGERLRVDTPDMAAFEPQKTYILQLSRDKGASVLQYSIPQALTVLVADGKMEPLPGKYAWFTGAEAFPIGTAYQDVRSTFVKVSQLKSCPQTR